MSSSYPPSQADSISDVPAVDPPTRNGVAELMRTIAMIFIAVLSLGSVAALFEIWMPTAASDDGSTTLNNQVMASAVHVVVLLSACGFCAHHEINRRKQRPERPTKKDLPELKRQTFQEFKKIGIVMVGMLAILVLCGIGVWASI